MHDPRVGRFFAIDPLAPKYPHNSPYAFSENTVINAIELEGLERYFTTYGEFILQLGYDQDIRVVDNKHLVDFQMTADAVLSNPSYINDPEAFLASEEGQRLNNFALAYSKYGYKSEVDAANAWGAFYNQISINNNWEYMAAIYSLEIDGGTYYFISETQTLENPYESDLKGVKIPNAAISVVDIHSHGAYVSATVYGASVKSNEFSPADMRGNRINERNGYVTTPNGSLLFYDYKADKVILINQDQPSDPNDPSSKDYVPANERESQIRSGDYFPTRN